MHSLKSFILVWATIKIKCVFLYLVCPFPQADCKFHNARMASALFSTLSPVLDTVLGMLQALRGSENNIPGRRYNKRKMSKRKKDKSVVQSK